MEIMDAEAKLLESYTSELEREENYYEGKSFTPEFLAMLCRMKDKNNARLDKKWQAAKAVIDLIAARIGIDSENTGYYLYAPDIDGSSPIIAKIDDYFSRSGDKVKLKKKIEELENENRILRSLIGK